jgi:hypothetical protein
MIMAFLKTFSAVVLSHSMSSFASGAGISMFVKSLVLREVGHAFLTDFLLWGVVMVTYTSPN